MARPSFPRPSFSAMVPRDLALLRHDAPSIGGRRRAAPQRLAAGVAAPKKKKRASKRRSGAKEANRFIRRVFFPFSLQLVILLRFYTRERARLRKLMPRDAVFKLKKKKKKNYLLVL